VRWHHVRSAAGFHLDRVHRGRLFERTMMSLDASHEAAEQEPAILALLKSNGWRIVKLKPSGWQTVDHELMLIVEDEL
jgi:hypothetical protein